MRYREPATGAIVVADAFCGDQRSVIGTMSVLGNVQRVGHGSREQGGGCFMGFPHMRTKPMLGTYYIHTK
jgi:hypothetical protein